MESNHRAEEAVRGCGAAAGGAAAASASCRAPVPRVFFLDSAGGGRSAAESRRPPSARRLRHPPPCPSRSHGQSGLKANCADGHQRRHSELGTPGVQDAGCVDAARREEKINLN